MPHLGKTTIQIIYIVDPVSAAMENVAQDLYKIKGYKSNPGNTCEIVQRVRLPPVTVS